MPDASTMKVRQIFQLLDLLLILAQTIDICELDRCEMWWFVSCCSSEVYIPDSPCLNPQLSFFPPFFRPPGYPAASQGLLELYHLILSHGSLSIMSAAIQLSSVWLFNNLPLVLVALGFMFLFIKIIYNLFLSPLCAIPGPWHYAMSDVFLLVHVVRLRQCKRVQELFETYGPVVRVGPNKVVFCDLSTTRNVYSVYKFDKSSYYKSLLTCVFLFIYFST